MVIDQYSSQWDLCHGGGDNDTNGDRDLCQTEKKTTKTRKRRIPGGNQIPRLTLGKMWSVLKTLNSNRRVCFEWLWSKKKTSSKDKGYGKLITDEEKRCLTMCFNIVLL